jgi:hypothetical protein
MPFRAPGNEEYTGTKFTPAAPDVYRVSVDSYEIKSGPEIANKYNEDGNPRVRFYLTPLGIDGDDEAEMVDISDEPLPEDKRFIFFFDPDHLGTKPRLAKSRKFMASVLNIATDQPVEYATLEDFCEDAVGRELIVDIEVKGEYNNILDTRPVKKRTRKRIEKEPMVVAAEKVFNETPDDGEDY